MTLIENVDRCIERMEHDSINNESYLKERALKKVTDSEVKDGVNILLYNHSVNTNQATKICGVSAPTFRAGADYLRSEGLIGETIEQGKAQKYNRYDLAVLMNYFDKIKFSDTYKKLAIAVMSHKGGVGKSTTVKTLAMAAALDTDINAIVGILDLDPQGSQGILGLTRQDGDIYLTMADINLRDFVEDSPFYKYVKEYGLDEETVILRASLVSHLPNLFIYSAFPDDERFTDVFHKLSIEDQIRLTDDLCKVVIPIVHKEIDILFIDLPPQDSPITWSALKASDMIITPVAPRPLDFLSTLNFVRFTRDRIYEFNLEDKIKNWSFVPVMLDETDRNQAEVMKRYRRVFSDMVFNSGFLKSELFTAADVLERSIYDIMKTEAKDNAYASPLQYDRAINSANDVYKTFKNILQNEFQLER